MTNLSSPKETTFENLIRNDKIQEAITQLLDLINSLSNHKEFLEIWSSQLISATNENFKSSIRSEDFEFQKNKIRANFLPLLTTIREQINAKISFYQPIPSDRSKQSALYDFIYTTLLKKYEDITPYAEGNTFVYFSAKELHSAQEVLVMVLKSSDAEEISNSGLLHKISRLKHRNLIQLLDLNFQTYPFYIITEFVSGITMRNLLSYGAFPFHSAKRLLLIIGDVANYLRQKNFMHSGIRPSKIILDKELEPEISPFDILQIQENKRLAITLLEDSYYYAPEILHSLTNSKTVNYNYQSDAPQLLIATDKANQFCLGALAYEMLTGEKLFEGKNLSETIMSRYRFFKDARYRKKKLSHELIPPQMSEVLKKMLQEKPEKRYDHLLTALSKIEAIKSLADEAEKLLFSSYQRCMRYSDNFIDCFEENLKKEPEIADEQKARNEKIMAEANELEAVQKLEQEKIEIEKGMQNAEFQQNLDKKQKQLNQINRKIKEEQQKFIDQKKSEEKKKFRENFFKSIHLFFNLKIADKFMERVANLPNNALERYVLFIRVFVQTIEQLDPRLESQPKTKKAWDKYYKHFYKYLNKHKSSREKKKYKTGAATETSEQGFGVDTTFQPMEAANESPVQELKEI